MEMDVMVSFAILIAFISCSSEESSLDVARRHMRKEHGAVERYLSTLPLQEQSFIVLQLAEEFPMQVGPLCGVLQDISAKQHCEKIAQTSNEKFDNNFFASWINIFEYKSSRRIYTRS